MLHHYSVSDNFPSPIKCCHGWCKWYFVCLDYSATCERMHLQKPSGHHDLVRICHQWPDVWSWTRYKQGCGKPKRFCFSLGLLRTLCFGTEALSCCDSSFTVNGTISTASIASSSSKERENIMIAHFSTLT